MKTRIIFLLLLGALIISMVPAHATNSYMSIINLYGQDTALINLTQWRASADYPAIVSSKPEPSQGGYYDVAIMYPAGQYLLVTNAWVMMNDMKVHGIESDPFPDVHATPTPGASTSPSSTSGGHSSWYDAGQAVIDFYFQNSFVLTCLEYVAILLLLLKKIFPSRGRRSKRWL